MTTVFHKYLANDILPKYQFPEDKEAEMKRLYNELWDVHLKGIHESNPRHYFGGSYAKRTMIKGSSDLDFVVYFPHTVQHSPKQLAEWVEKILQQKHNTERIGVATQISYKGFDIDVVVGKAIDGEFKFANLWNSKEGKEMRTSLTVHCEQVKGVEQVVKAFKIWRLCHKLNWHKLAMEQSIVRALEGKPKNDWGECFKTVLLDIKSNIDNVKFLDPANSNNPIFVTEKERVRIKEVASACCKELESGNFKNIVW